MVDCRGGYSSTVPSSVEMGGPMSMTTPINSVEGELSVLDTPIIVEEGVAMSLAPPPSGDCVRLLVLHDYDGCGDDELTLRRGQSVELLSTDEMVSGGPGWWIGMIDGKVGVFPSNHVDNTEPPIISFEHIEFLELIGVGGFGRVHRAIWAGEEVAVKTTRHVLDHDWPESVEQVRREAKLFWLLEHRNVVLLRGVVLSPPNLCLVMEYCRGGSLSSTLSQKKLLPHVLVNWAVQIADGMEYLHHGAPVSVIHRDLKSSNVLLDVAVDAAISPAASNPQAITLKISDLGLARQTFDSNTMRMTQAGTYAWMAPEAIERSAYSRATDVWSYGVLLWELLTGETPYRGIDALAVAYGVASHKLRLPVPETCPEVWHQLMLACWSRDPNARPSFRQIRHKLDSISQSAFVTDSHTFHNLQESWRLEINTVLQKIRDHETELRIREVDLYRREQQLIERERNLLQREMQVFIKQQQQQQLASVPNKRQKGKLWSRSKLHGPIKISGPSDFRHNASLPNPCLACEREKKNCGKSGPHHRKSDSFLPLIDSLDTEPAACPNMTGYTTVPVTKTTASPGPYSQRLNGEKESIGAAGALSPGRMKTALYNMTTMLASLAIGRDVRHNRRTTYPPPPSGLLLSPSTTRRSASSLYYRCKSTSDMCDSSTNRHLNAFNPPSVSVMANQYLNVPQSQTLYGQITPCPRRRRSTQSADCLSPKLHRSCHDPLPALVPEPAPPPPDLLRSSLRARTRGVPGMAAGDYRRSCSVGRTAVFYTDVCGRGTERRSGSGSSRSSDLIDLNFD